MPATISRNLTYIVSTLCVGTPQGTLRVPYRRAAHAAFPRGSVGTIRFWSADALARVPMNTRRVTTG